MAKYDAIRIKGKMWLGLSNDESVGAGGRNKTDDVMLIQTMLHYLEPFELYAGDVVPRLTGTFDADTGDAIRNFQREYSMRLFRPDGIIHPPSYEGRDLKNTFNPLMTMTFLHLLCKQVTPKHGHARYAIGMPRMYPQLQSRLRHPGLVTVPFLA